MLLEKIMDKTLEGCSALGPALLAGIAQASQGGKAHK